MSVATLTNRNDYTGTGSVGPFPYTFRILDATHLRVTRRDPDGAETTLAFPADYGVTGVQRETGGNVTLTAVLPVGWDLSIRRVVPLTQTTEFSDGPFFPEIHEDAFDKLTMIAQQFEDVFDRSLHLPETVDPDDVSVELPVPSPGKVLAWNGDGSALVNVVVGDGSVIIPDVEEIDVPTGRLAPDVTTYLKNNAFFNVLDYLAVGDGSHDDTTMIQAALDAASTAKGLVYVPARTYIVLPIFVKSNTVIFFEPGAVFKAKSGYGVNDRLFNVTNVSNVTVHGNGATVQMLKAAYAGSSEQRHGVFVTGGCYNVRVYDLTSIDSGGDNFYIGSAGGSVPQLIRLIGVLGDNAYRNGISITAGIDVRVEGTFKGATGTAPQAGVCIEPNNGTDFLQNIVVRPKTISNDGSGVIVVPRYLGDAADNYMTVTIEGHESYDDAKDNGLEASARFDSAAVPTNQINGKIVYRGGRSNRCNNAGVIVGRYCWKNCPALLIDDVQVMDPGTTATASTFAAAGVALYTGVGVGDIQNVTLRNVYCADRRATKKMYVAFWLSGTTPYIVRDSALINCDGEGWLLANSGPFATFGSVVNLQVRTGMERARLFEFGSGNFNLQRYPGLLLSQTGSGVLTLPTATSTEGLEWEFVNRHGTTMQVRPQTGDTLEQYGAFASNDMVSRQVGDYVRLRSLGGTSWAIMEVSGTWSPLTAGQRGRPWGTYGGITADIGDADTTVVLGLTEEIVRYGSARTAHRTVTIDTSKAKAGDRCRVIVADNTSGFNVITPVKTVPSFTAAFVDITWNGAGLILTGYGLLQGLDTINEVVSPNFKTATNSLTAATATFVDIFTPSSQGAYDVYCYATNGGNTYDLHCTVWNDGTNIWVREIAKGSNVTSPQISGGKLQYKQSGGGPITLRWVYTHHGP